MSADQAERLAKCGDGVDPQELVGMMLPKETEMAVQLKEEYAKANADIREEVGRYLKDNVGYLGKAMTEMLKRGTQLATEVLTQTLRA